MIFVTVGTHPEGFERLIRRIDEIAPYINEKIIVQIGFTKYKPVNVEYFDFTQNLDEYYKKARIVISHSATTLLEFVLNQNKPVISVPRQKRYGEHINDHQVEFALYLSKRLGIITIMDINKITPDLIKSYNKVAEIDRTSLKKLQARFREEFLKMEGEIL